MGRIDEASETLARYGAAIADEGSDAAASNPSWNETDTSQSGARPRSVLQLGLSAALTLAALAWGFVNFGVLLWLPGTLIAEGRTVGLTSALIARSALIAVPTIAVATYLYTRWSTKRVLMLAIGITTLGLVATLVRNTKALHFFSNPLISVSLLIVGTSAVISILMPYAVESFPVRQRGRATGWVAGCSKVGGVIAQTFATFALVPAFGLAAGAIAIPTLASLVLIAAFGHETRGRDLRELETDLAMVQRA